MRGTGREIYQIERGGARRRSIYSRRCDSGRPRRWAERRWRDLPVVIASNQSAVPWPLVDRYCPVQITKTVRPYAGSVSCRRYSPATLIGKKAAEPTRTRSGWALAQRTIRKHWKFCREEWCKSLPRLGKYDLNDFYVDVVTAGDGVDYL